MRHRDGRVVERTMVGCEVAIIVLGKFLDMSVKKRGLTITWWWLEDKGGSKW